LKKDPENAPGDRVFEKIIENEKIEWDGFESHASNYVIEAYLPIK